MYNMESGKIVAESVGFVATAIFIYSSSLTDDKKLSFFYTIGCFLLASHLLLLGSMYAGVVTAISGFRNLLAPFDKSGKLKKAFMMVFITLLAYSIAKADTFIDVIPALASVVMSYAFLYTTKNALSACIFVSASLWLMVGISLGSVSLIILEASTMATLLYRVIKSNYQREAI